MNQFDFYIDVRKSYSDFEVNINLGLVEGEFFSLLGPSGCGKTTFLRLIAGLEKNEGGTIILNGVDVSALPPTERKIGMVFQEYALFPHLNVTENIGYGLKAQKMSRTEMKNKIERMLTLFDLESLRRRNVQQLSGGEKQRVALARALVTEPHILLLDEPFSALDYNLRSKLRQELRLYQKKLGFTTIFVTHQQEEALILSDRLGVMQNGKLLQVGKADQIYEHPTSRFVAEFIGEANFITGQREPHSNRVNFSLANETLSMTIPSEADSGANHWYAMIRPEDIQIAPTTKGKDNSLSLLGKIHRIDYMGYMYRIEVSSDAVKEPFIIYHAKSIQPPVEGTEVHLTFIRDAFHLIPN